MQKNENRSIAITQHKTQIQVYQRPQYKSRFTEEKVGNSLECIGTEDNFLDRTPIAQALQLTIKKWDLMKLKRFYKAKTPSIRQNSSLQNGKRSSPSPYITNSRNQSSKPQIIQSKIGYRSTQNSQQKNLKWPRNS